MTGTIITWNATNWITIFLMAALGFAIVGAISQVVKQQTN